MKHQRKNSQKVKEARSLAMTYHKGQIDKNGESYFNHLERVAKRGNTENEVVLGYLHDLLEDTSFEEQPGNLSDKFGQKVVKAVIKMSKKDTSLSYFKYIQFVATDDLAKRVKKNDLKDNMNLFRFIRNGKIPKVKDLKRVFKYMRAYLILSIK